MEGEPVSEGEDGLEGEGADGIEGGSDEEGEPMAFHSADLDGDGTLSLTELLRVIQLHNAGALHCAESGSESDDGYAPSVGVNQDCPPHNSDYAPQDWVIGLSELLRAIQLHNADGYRACTDEISDDGFCIE